MHTMYERPRTDNNAGTDSNAKNVYVDINTIPQYETPSYPVENTAFSRYNVKYSPTPEEKITNVFDKNTMPSVFDVARYILYKIGDTITTMKLHKLLYYCQVWHIVWEDKPLFPQTIEAWANGPVVRELFNFHKGMFDISFQRFTLGNISRINGTQKEDIDIVLQTYGDKSSQWLVNQTHQEAPWIEARKGLAPLERGNAVITLEAIHQYYSSLP